MPRSATSVWSTGRGGRGACKGRRSPLDVFMYRPAKTLAVAVGGFGIELPIRKEKAKYYVAVASASQTAKQWALASTTATGVVGRITAVVVSRSAQSVPPPNTPTPTPTPTTTTTTTSTFSTTTREHSKVVQSLKCSPRA